MWAWCRVHRRGAASLTSVAAAGLLSAHDPAAPSSLAPGLSPPVAPAPLPPGHSRLVILGSGNSTGTPRPVCLMDPGAPNCANSRLAMLGRPSMNRNYRCVGFLCRT